MNLLLEHFNLLTGQPEHIAKLKGLILQLAVQGKLVPQDPNDEPASRLLQRTAAEKERLVKEKKIKKEAPLPAIAEEEIPYDLPEGWSWCRLGEIAIKLGAGSTPLGGKEVYSNTG
jgi:type I restriction enzyme S subunit